MADVIKRKRYRVSAIAFMVIASLLLIAWHGVKQIERGVRAYLYGYPLVLMDATKTATVGDGVNRVNHSRTFPDHAFRRVVRPNVDTLYSTIWFDLAAEPVVVELPDSEGRYYLVPFMDAWTNVFASIGTRTTGGGPQQYLVVGPNWSGGAPNNMTVLRSPTRMAWAIGRINTLAGLENGDPSADMLAAHNFQSRIVVTPLSAWQDGARYVQTEKRPIPGMENRPAEAVAQMDANTFFTRMMQLMQDNKPAPVDAPFVERVLAPLGLTPEDAKNFDGLSFIQEWTLSIAMQKIPDIMARIGSMREYSETYWTGMPQAGVPLGRYGTNYPLRAYVAHVGLGANEPEDAIYPMAIQDASGEPLNGSQNYVLHFPAAALPPVNGFWSLTLYNEDAYLVENPIGRYAVGGRDPLIYNTDGSLDIYVQPSAPASPFGANWLPSVEGQPFSLTMRLYWPKDEVLNGLWVMPAVQKAG